MNQLFIKKKKSYKKLELCEINSFSQLDIQHDNQIEYKEMNVPHILQ